MTAILAFLARPIGKFASIAFGALTLWGLFEFNNYSQRQRGADLVVAKIERKNNAAASTARAAARGVTDPRVRGIEDPNAVDE